MSRTDTEERAPLLRSDESSTSGTAAEDDKAPAISTSRGALVCTSIGLLIFLQGTYHLYYYIVDAFLSIIIQAILLNLTCHCYYHLPPS